MTPSLREPSPHSSTQEPPPAKSGRISFRDGNHDRHVQVLLDWLHPDLHELPGIDWTRLPSRVIKSLVHLPEESPFRMHVALVIGAALDAVQASTLYGYASTLPTLFSFLREHYVSWDGKRFTAALWEEYATKATNVAQRRRHLIAYSAATERHLPEYLDQLEPAIQARLKPYLLPRLPKRFLERYANAELVQTEQRRRRKEKSDVLVPLYSILVALIQFRKQAIGRLVVAFREACERAERGVPLPLLFGYEEVCSDIRRDAQTISDVCLEQRVVQLRFRLWNRRTWVKAHAPTVGESTRLNAKQQREGYRPEQDHYFVEFLGDPSELFWFGDLLADGLMMHLGGVYRRRRLDCLLEHDPHRLAQARALGVSRGFATERGGLLTPGGRLGQWLTFTAQRSGALLFEPESLYRGCLFAVALTTIVLTNGSRLSELLQISADRFKGHTYEEKINGQLTGKQRVIWLQHLLPKGKTTEEERQLFPLSPLSYELLREIAQLLREQHGCIPIVFPHPDHHKAEHLKPERYLFQWAASADG